jgi:hypothetical protein
MDPSALLTNLKAKIETSQQNIENYQNEVAEAEAKITALQTHIHVCRSGESAEQSVLEKLNKSRVRLEETVAALAEEWGLSSDSTPTDKPASKLPEQQSVSATPSAVVSTTPKKGKRESSSSAPTPTPAAVPAPTLVPEPTPAPAPAPAPTSVPTPDVGNNDDEDGEDSFEVMFKGAKYIVFEDNMDVIRADDEAEDVVGKWDPERKTIVFN